MADYKIANIKWLREKGWGISSSYADSICPTYNEIVNEIPKNSIKVDVNGTCIATSKAYANNQLVCESDITIKGKPAPQYSVSTNLKISNGSSGSLRVTGSTYTAEFVIAGPKAGTGTLTGTLTADTRDKMTFRGYWDGSPGATIYNSCTSHATQGIYKVGDAHWDISKKKLYVYLTQCTL